MTSDYGVPRDPQPRLVCRVSRVDSPFLGITPPVLLPRDFYRCRCRFRDRGPLYHGMYRFSSIPSFILIPTISRLESYSLIGPNRPFRVTISVPRNSYLFPPSSPHSLNALYSFWARRLKTETSSFSVLGSLHPPESSDLFRSFVQEGSQRFFLVLWRLWN